jgi:hypothetical protein
MKTPRRQGLAVARLIAGGQPLVDIQWDYMYTTDRALRGIRIFLAFFRPDSKLETCYAAQAFRQAR